MKLFNRSRGKHRVAPGRMSLNETVARSLRSDGDVLRRERVVAVMLEDHDAAQRTVCGRPVDFPPLYAVQESA